MDKATYVFNKYAAAGWWKKTVDLGKKLVGAGRKEFGKSTKYIQREMKGEFKPLTTMKKTQITSMKDFTKARGPINSGRMQTQLEQTLNKNLRTTGKIGVSPPVSKEELARRVARDKYMQQFGM